MIITVKGIDELNCITAAQQAASHHPLVEPAGSCETLTQEADNGEQ